MDNQDEIDEGGYFTPEQKLLADLIAYITSGGMYPFLPPPKTQECPNNPDKEWVLTPGGYILRPREAKEDAS